MLKKKNIIIITLLTLAFLMVANPLFSSSKDSSIYESWWFRVVVSIVFLLAILLLFRINMKRIRSRQQQLEQINNRLNREVLERKLVEKALQQSEEKYREIFEKSIDVLYRADMKGKLTLVSPSGVKLLAYDNQQELLGQDVAETFYANKDDRKRFLAEINKTGKVVNFQVALKCKDGRLINVEVNSQLLYEKNGQPSGVEGIIRDITDRKKAEQENIHLQEKLQNAKKMEAVGTLAGGMAHEFNNLMAVIIGNANLLKERLPNISSKSIYSSQLERIIRSSDRCSVLTNQLLSFSRKQLFILKTLNLNDLIIALTGDMRKMSGPQIKVFTRLDPQPVQIKVDAELMKQVIMGIAQNAVDAMPQGGTFYVETGIIQLRHHKKEGEQKREGEYVCLSFTDTGIGMDDETLQHIFEPFFTTKEGGWRTGLQLSFVYGTILQLNGWIDVSSAPVNGTCMKLYLPIFY